MHAWCPLTPGEWSPASDHNVRGLVQTIFGKISVIVTLGGGGGGGVKAMTLRKFYCPRNI